jgi:hypothetical protein
VPRIFTPPLLLCRHEQALVEAYAADGWRGASREKVKPVAEIKRAKDQVGGEGRLLQYLQFSTCSITVLAGWGGYQVAGRVVKWWVSRVVTSSLGTGGWLRACLLMLADLL